MSSIRAAFPAVRDTAEKLGAHLAAAAPAGKPVNVVHSVLCVTTDVIGTLLFGRNLGALDGVHPGSTARFAGLLARCRCISPLVPTAVICRTRPPRSERPCFRPCPVNALLMISFSLR